MKSKPYLLLKATALQVPLLDKSVGLVIGTPPGLGEKRARKQQFCTNDLREYELMMAQFQAEAARIVKPSGYILLYPGHLQKGMTKVFEVFQKQMRRGRPALVHKTSAKFTTRYGNVKDFYWDAIPVWVYAALIRRYSEAGETIAHVFSGSGNSAIAALELSRKSVLIDLHYHRQVQRRLRKWAESRRRKPKSSAKMQETKFFAAAGRALAKSESLTEVRLNR